MRSALRADPVLLATVMVGFSSVCFGLVPFFARSLVAEGIAPPAIAFFRYMFAAVAFLPFLRLGADTWRASLWGYVSGFCVGMGWIGYVKALSLLPVAISGVLYMTYPLFTLLIGWVLFQDRPALVSAFGGGLILIAAVIAARGSASGLPVTLHAIALALAAPLAFGFSINVLTHRLGALTPLSRIAVFALGSATGLVPLILTYPSQAVIPSQPSQWALVVSLGIFSALLPQLIYNTYVPRIGGARAAALGGIELPTMFAVGWIAFGETISFREVIAGLLVLVAIFLTPAVTQKKKEPMP